MLAKSKNDGKAAHLFTVFTATFNRANCIDRVFNSLTDQTFTDFEWLIVDDGSTDNTEQVVRSLQAESDFEIRYIKIEHGGKPAAWNVGVDNARGELFVSADSDDAFIPGALDELKKMYFSIPKEARAKYRGVSCRCFDVGGGIVGDKDIPSPYLDATSPDAVFKYGINYELWGANRTDVLKQFRFPIVDGLKFYPEIIIWDKMSEHYLSRFFNTPLRIIYDDQENKTTTKKSNCRYKENYYLWSHYLNDLSSYFRYRPLMFLKSAIGVVRDGCLSGFRWVDVIRGIRFLPFRLLAVLGSPFAFVLAKTGM